MFASNAAVPKARRQTLYFLEKARENCPVYLSTAVDMRAVKTHRDQAGETLSYISYLIFVIARVLTEIPAANFTAAGFFWPRLVPNKQIDAKFTLDKTINGTRAVVSTVLKHADNLSLREIQQTINYYRDTPFDDIKEFSKLRLLQRLPMPIGRWLYNRLFASVRQRQMLQGSFTVTSLGKSSIQLFLPMTSSTLAFGVGSILQQPVWENSQWQSCPQLTLSMVFDHRVIDGALAAELLERVKTQLENFSTLNSAN